MRNTIANGERLSQFNTLVIAEAINSEYTGHLPREVGMGLNYKMASRIRMATARDKSNTEVHPAVKPRRDLYDWLMFGVGLAGTVAVAVTILIGRVDQASNGKDVHDAIAKMAAIAVAMQNQKPLLERQADAAADSASAAKTTATLAKGQTTAIVQQANALVQSAQATIRASEAQLASAQANIKAAESGAKAAEEQRRSAELFSSTRAPVSTLSEVELDGWLAPEEKDGSVKIKVTPKFANTGGGTLFPGITTFNLIVGNYVPSIKPTVDQKQFGFNVNPIAPQNLYFPHKPFEYNLSKLEINDANKAKKAIIVWGTAKFSDIGKTQYIMCYIAQINPPSADTPTSVVPITIPTYDCPSK